MALTQVNSAGIKDGEIVNADVNASAAIAGSKLAAATTSVAGSMSAADKTKLDGIAASANAYVHPNHTGDVTSTADGATVIAAGAVDIAMLATGTDGKIITWDASGNPTTVGPGTDGQVLTSTGAGSPPAFEDAAAGGISDIVSDTSPQLGGNLDVNTKNILIGDSSDGASDDVLIFGADTDCKYYFHNSDNKMYVKAPGTIQQESGWYYVRANNFSVYNNAGSETVAKFLADGACELYYNNDKRFETKSSSCHVSGNFGIESGGASYLHFFDVATNTLSFFTNSVNLILRDEPNSDNCMKFEADGEIIAEGGFTTAGVDYAEYFESTDGSAIAVGTTVVLENGKVRAATGSETPIGVVRPKVSGTSVTAGAAELRWTGKYLIDDYDGKQTENAVHCSWKDEGENKQCWKDRPPTGVTIPTSDILYTDSDAIPADKKVGDIKITKAIETTLVRPQLNPDFDASKTYVPRSERAEWNNIGLLGQIPITKGQPVASNWIKMSDRSSTVELWFVK